MLLNGHSYYIALIVLVVGFACFGIITYLFNKDNEQNSESYEDKAIRLIRQLCPAELHCFNIGNLLDRTKCVWNISYNDIVAYSKDDSLKENLLFRFVSSENGYSIDSIEHYGINTGSKIPMVLEYLHHEYLES